MTGNKGMSGSHKVIWVIILMIWGSYFLVFFLLLASNVAAKSKKTVPSSGKLNETSRTLISPTICDASSLLCISDNTQGPHFFQRGCECIHKMDTQTNTGAERRIRVWAPSVSVIVLHPLLDGNLTRGLSILRTVIPKCHSPCSFSCFRAGASIPRNMHSLRCCLVTMQHLHSFAFPPFLLESFLLLPFSHPMLGKCWNHAGIWRWNRARLVCCFLIEGMQKLSELQTGTHSFVLFQGFESNCSLHKQPGTISVSINQ